MNPTPETPTPPPASPAAPAEQPAPTVQTFTADQVAEREQAAARKAHDAAMAEARRVFEGKQKPASTAQTTQAPPPAPTTATGSTRAYERAIAAYDFPEEAMALLDEEFDRVKPADPRAFVEQRATAFRVPKRGATPTTATSTPATALSAPVVAPAGQPVTSNGAPTSSTTVTADTPLIQMSEADRVAFIRQHGDVAYTDRFKREARERNARVPLAALLRR